MKKILGILISLMMASTVYASVAVSPTKIEINANNARSNYITAAIDIKGAEGKPTRYKLYPGYFTINEKSKIVTTDLATDDPHDISKRVRFVPSEFTIVPGKSQKVRININNVKLLADGENRAILYIEDVQPKEAEIDTGVSGIGAKIILKTRVAVPIYVDKGNFTKIGEIETFNIVKEKDGLYTTMKILSKGNSKIRYTAKMYILDGKKLISEYKVDGHAVGNNNYYVAKDKIPLNKIKGVGEYTIRAVVTYENEKGKKVNIKKEAQLNITNNM